MADQARIDGLPEEIGRLQAAGNKARRILAVGMAAGGLIFSSIACGVDGGTSGNNNSMGTQETKLFEKQKKEAQDPCWGTNAIKNSCGDINSPGNTFRRSK